MQFLIIFLFIYGFFAALGYYYKTGENKEGWLYADKAVSNWLTAISTAATSIGGSATIVLGYMIFTHGWDGIIIDLPVGIGILTLGIFLAPKLRKENVNTVPELLGKYYGEPVRKISATFIVITEMAWFGLLVKSFNVFLPANGLISHELLIIFSGLLFLSYIYWSGQRGVYITDLFQSIIIIAGIIILLIWTISDANQMAINSPVEIPLTYATRIGFFAMMFLSGISGPDILSRVFYAKTERAAKTGLIWGGLIKISVTLIVGTIAYKAKFILPELTDGYKLFPDLIRHYFGFPFDSIMLVVFLLIMVSSADTVTMTAITTLNNDLLKPGGKIRNIRYQVWGLGLFGILMALYFSSILDIMKLAYTFYAAGPGLFVIYAFFGIRLSFKNASLIILLSGFSAIVFELFFNQAVNPILLASGLNILGVIIFRKQGD